MEQTITLYTEINIISIIFVAVLFGRSKKLNKIKGTNQYLQALASLTIFILADAISYLMIHSAIPSSKEGIIIGKSIYFMFTTIMGYHWLLYFECKGNSIVSKNRWIRYLLGIFVGIQLVMTIVNLKAHFFFYVNDLGEYCRGNLFFLQYMFAYFYVGIAVIRAFYFAVAGTNYIDRGYILTLAVFPVFPAIAGIVQFFYPWIPVACVAMTLSAMMLYFNNIDEMVFVDPLTGLVNRRNFMNTISSKMKSVNPTDQLYLLMIDVDYFKEINDTYGHVEGDKALVRVAEVLTNSTREFNRKVKIGRFGGDEFIIVVEGDDTFPIKQLVDGIQQEMKKSNQEAKTSYNIGLSIGYAQYQSSMKMVRDFIASADESLYIVKEARHKRMKGA